MKPYQIVDCKVNGETCNAFIEPCGETVQVRFLELSKNSEIKINVSYVHSTIMLEIFDLISKNLREPDAFYLTGSYLGQTGDNGEQGCWDPKIALLAKGGNFYMDIGTESVFRVSGSMLFWKMFFVTFEYVGGIVENKVIQENDDNRSMEIDSNKIDSILSGPQTPTVEPRELDQANV